MLRRQNTPLDPMSFLSGAGEMAKRIREHDWTGHPFGAPPNWPQSLRSALSICLHSSFPTAIYWGSELRLLYNDAWAPIPGPRHPAALGAPAQEVWADIWHVIEPQFSSLIETGEGIFVEDQMLPMRRFGAVEETYWSYSFTAIRGEDGAIAGVFNSGHETTRNVLSRREMSFLLELNEAFRSTDEVKESRRIAIRMLGEHIGADRVGFRQIVPSSGDLAVVDEWTAAGVSPIGAGVPISLLGEWAYEQLKAGHALRINDVAAEANLAESRLVFAELGVGAAAAVPWMVRGRVVAIIFMHSREPRIWTDYNISTAEEALERTLGWMEREQTAERERTMMREIDHRARNALAVVQSVVRLTHAGDVSSFREKIGDRINALARTHDLLSSERWQPIELKALVKDELAAYIDSARVSTTGPHLELRPEQAQTIALLLHELATNAAKYGALSRPGGTLEICWSAPTQGMLEIDWTEQLQETTIAIGVPERSGFGSMLLRRVVEDQLGGTLMRTFEPRGLRCRLAIPLEVASRNREQTSPSISPQAKSSKRILIVEDEPLLAMDLEGMVADMGFTVFATAANVKDALASLDNDVPDLAILDANLSGASSEPVAAALQALDVPVIFATGYAQLTNMSDAVAALPRLSKPITLECLAKTICNLGFSVTSP
jgi:two-component sensor histidine kinase/CheY-like chemotaxis protein